MRIGDTQPYRGIEFGVFETQPGEWNWSYYPKMENGNKKTGQTKGARENAIAACKAAIDEWLGPANSN